MHATRTRGRLQEVQTRDGVQIVRTTALSMANGHQFDARATSPCVQSMALVSFLFLRPAGCVHLRWTLATADCSRSDHVDQ